MVRIPEEYQEVEYIESTGEQYIITNYYPQTDWTAVDWTFAFTASQNGDQMLWGARSATNGKKIWQCEKYSGRYWYVACGSVSYRTVLADYGGKLNQIYTGHVDNTTFTVDGGSASPNQTNTGENESAMGIFCWNKNGTAEYKNSGLRIYSLTFKENDIVSANFIPCYRKSDNEIGMYDTVSKTFFTNQGTGTFLKGNDVNYDTVNLMESRRRILLNTPHIESLSGSTLSFETDMVSKLKECRIHFTPIQEGSGDPSPENVRPIHGWDGVSLNVNGTSLTIPFPQTIYGGYVDLVKGEVVETTGIVDLSTINFQQYGTSNHCWSRIDISDMKLGKDFNTGELYCDSYEALGKASILSNGKNFGIWPYNTSLRTLILRNDTYIGEDGKYNINALRESLSGVMACYPLATSTTYPLDPVTIRTLKGLNNIFSSANGNIEISYWVH